MLRRQFSSILILLMIFSLLSSSCTQSMKARKQASGEEQPGESEMMPMPRADPGYLQYLERNSMLTRSSEMAKVVSGSELAWHAPGSAGTPDELLSFADIWLAVHPLTILTSHRSSTFGQLNDPAIWPVLREVGVKGLYMSPVQGSGALWAKNRTGVDTGEDVVQYAFSRAAGSDDEYNVLMRKTIDNHAIVGSDLIPAATGLGPDFFLAARNVREYPGVYCMVSIPQDLWKHLPEVPSEWETTALNGEQIEALNGEGLLPKSMSDSSSAFGKGTGWATTGEVRGVDGNIRRWVYRYHNNPKFAVLNWEDPSKTASRILSGGAVQQVGLRGQALIGLKLEAFQGLEAAPSKPSGKAALSIEPALTAAQSLSREIRRYNGWSWIKDDNLPLTAVADFLRAGSDFIFDSAFSPAAEHALLTGDSSLACFMADELLRLNIDSRRLVHAMPAQDGINYSLPYLRYLEATSAGSDARSFRNAILQSRDNFVSHVKPSPVQDGFLYTTSAGLAAMALDLPKTDTKSYASEVAKGHSLLVFFKAMQPGVLMLSGQDIAGVMPLHYSSMSGSSASWDVANASRGSYALTSASESLTVTSMGMPRAQQIYPAPDQQVHEQGSFLRSIGGFLRMRSQSGLAKGTLLSRPRTKNTGSIALLTRMPDRKGFVLSVCNFSRSKVTETISLPAISGMNSATGNVKVVSLGGSHTISGNKVTFSLGPWEARALFLGSAANGVKNVTGGKVTAVNALVAPPREEPVITPVDSTAPKGTAVAIDKPRSDLPETPAASVVASTEPVGNVIPLARISEETVGRAKVRSLRPGQPEELVTTLPQFGDGPALAEAAPKKSPRRSPAASTLFGGSNLAAQEQAGQERVAEAPKKRAAKPAQKKTVAAKKPVVAEPLDESPAVPARPVARAKPRPTPTRAPAAPPSLEHEDRSFSAKSPDLESPDINEPPLAEIPVLEERVIAEPAPVNQPVVAETPSLPQRPAAPGVRVPGESAVLPPIPIPGAAAAAAAAATAGRPPLPAVTPNAPGTGEMQKPVLPPRRTRAASPVPPADSEDMPSTLRVRTPVRPPSYERTRSVQPSRSFAPAVNDGSRLETERLSD